LKINTVSWFDVIREREFSSSFWFYLVPRFFTLLFLVIWVVLGAISAGLLWPPQVRKWLWESSKEDVSQKKTIQDIKSILTFEEKESLLEKKFYSIKVEIKNDIKSQNDQMKREMNSGGLPPVLPGNSGCRPTTNSTA
jgi:hypothetical protein